MFSSVIHYQISGLTTPGFQQLDSKRRFLTRLGDCLRGLMKRARRQTFCHQRYHLSQLLRHDHQKLSCLLISDGDLGDRVQSAPPLLAETRQFKKFSCPQVCCTWTNVAHIVIQNELEVNQEQFLYFLLFCKMQDS